MPQWHSSSYPTLAAAATVNRARIGRWREGGASLGIQPDGGRSGGCGQEQRGDENQGPPAWAAQQSYVHKTSLLFRKEGSLSVGIPPQPGGLAAVHACFPNEQNQIGNRSFVSGSWPGSGQPILPCDRLTLDRNKLS